MSVDCSTSLISLISCLCRWCALQLAVVLLFFQHSMCLPWMILVGIGAASSRIGRQRFGNCYMEAVSAPRADCPSSLGSQSVLLAHAWPRVIQSAKYCLLH